MREQNIRIEPFHLLNIRRFQIQKSSNEHPAVYVEGTIPDTETDAVVERSAANRKLTINAIDDSGGVRTLFNGLIKEIGVHTENGLRILSIQGVSYTILMDQEKRIRPFQSGNTKYQRIIDSIERDNQDFGVLIQEHGDDRIGRTMIQYKETDWEFVASRLHTVVIPNSTLNNLATAISPRLTGSGWQCCRMCCICVEMGTSCNQLLSRLWWFFFFNGWIIARITV